MNITNKTYLILTLVPYPYGGGESFLHQTVSWAQKAGYRCVWVAFSRKEEIHTTIRSKDNCIYHTYAGYPEERHFESIMTLYQPDVIHTQGPIIYSVIPFFSKRRISLLVGFHFWHGVLLPTSEGGFINKNLLEDKTQKLDSICQDNKPFIEYYVASEFINSVIASRGGKKINNVIYPIPVRSHYWAEEEQEKKYITCINVNRGKGGNILYQVAKEMKDLQFFAVCNEPNEDGLDDLIRDLPNVTVVSYMDVKEIYAQTRILLIPTQVDETFSRVAYEGAACGLPILTTGKGYIRYLLGEDAIYLSDKKEVWIEAIRDLLSSETLLHTYGDKLKKRMEERYPSQEPKFIKLVDDLFTKTPRHNIMLLVPWCDQGLGHQGKLYSKLLRREGYRVHIFSFLSYFCLDSQDKFRIDEKEWTDYDTIYESYNTREEITQRELRQFVISRNIGLCLIPEICYAGIFEKVKILNTLAVRSFAVPNIETCRKDELEKYKCFEKILCNTRQCYNVLKEEGVENLVYIGHCLPPLIPEITNHPKPKDGVIKFLHVSGYNAISRKQTLVVLEAFTQAWRLFGDRIALTITFSRNVPPEVYTYTQGVTLLTEAYSHTQILKLYREHHISIQVSSHEGLGLGFYESIAAETPIISLDQAPHNEAVIEGKSGWLLPSTPIDLEDNNQSMVKGGKVDSKILAEKIISIICHPGELKKVEERIITEKNKWSDRIFIQRLIRAIN